MECSSVLLECKLVSQGTARLGLVGSQGTARLGLMASQGTARLGLVGSHAQPG